MNRKALKKRGVSYVCNQKKVAPISDHLLNSIVFVLPFLNSAVIR